MLLVFITMTLITILGTPGLASRQTSLTFLPQTRLVLAPLPLTLTLILKKAHLLLESVARALQATCYVWISTGALEHLTQPPFSPKTTLECLIFIPTAHKL